jgi:hemerythrin-like domain-containing protein
VDDFAAFEDESFSYSRRGPNRKSAPREDPLQDILETLYSEHRYISSLLDSLEQQAEKLKPGKVPDYYLLLEIIDYLTHYPDQYHHPREDLLFSGMLKNDSKFRAKLDRLEREHETLHSFTHELFNELTRVKEGRPVHRPELLRRISGYISGYRKHIDYENRQVFPRARGGLTAADLKKLNAKTRYIDDPLFGGQVQYQYRRLGRNLQARVEVASQDLIVREMTGIESFIENLSGLVDTLDQLKDTVNKRRRDSWREQMDTVKAHARFNESPNIISLPGALMKNHLRHLDEGFSEAREILGANKKKKEDDKSND